MKRVIVTGANGFIGAAVVRELIRNNVEVVALVNGNNKENIPVSPLVSVMPFSLENVYEVVPKVQNMKIDTFFHFAWAGSAGEARGDAELQLKNALWTIECLKMCKEIGCKRFVNAGSIMEIETYKATFKNGNKPGMGYIYGSGKLVAHTMCKAVAENIGVELVWGIITNAYGIGEKSPRMVNTTIRKCIKKESPKFTAGTQNYDFIYIDDVARAFYLIGKNGKAFHEYLIGSSNAKTLKEFLLEMQAAIAPDIDFVFGDIPFTGVNLSLEDFDCSLTEKDTGFRAEISFAEGCKRTFEWWKNMEGEDNADI